MVYQESVNTFIEVIKTQPNLFTAKDWIELAEIVNKLSEDSEEIWQAIKSWIDSHPDIKTAYETLEDTSISPVSLGGYLGPGNSKPAQTSNQPTGDPALLEKLKNEINLHKSNDSSKQ